MKGKPAAKAIIEKKITQKEHNLKANIESTTQKP